MLILNLQEYSLHRDNKLGDGRWMCFGHQLPWNVSNHSLSDDLPTFFIKDDTQPAIWQFLVLSFRFGDYLYYHQLIDISLLDNFSVKVITVYPSILGKQICSEGYSRRNISNSAISSSRS